MKYGTYTDIDHEIAVVSITNWKKDPNKNIVDSLQEIESLNTHLFEVSKDKFCIPKLVVTQLFLSGLPAEYSITKSSMASSGKVTNRDFVLGVLEAEEWSIVV